MELWRDHLFCGVAHLVQSGVALGLVAKDVQDDAPQWPLDIRGWQEIVATGEYHLGWLVPIFPLLSSVNHLYSAISPTYLESVEESESNGLRAAEYAVSASLMIWIIGTLSGITDVASLASLVLANVGMQFVGWLAEKRKKAGASIEELWQLTLVGWILFFIQWVPILISFHVILLNSEVKPPPLVMTIIWTMLSIFALFGLTQYLYLFRGWSHFKYERTYIWLSLVAKSLLTWLVVGGVLAARARFKKKT